MSFRNILITLAIVLPTLAFSQKKDTLSTNAKIDSIFALQQRMYSESKNEPLKDKKYGVELNLFRLIAMTSTLSISGTVSLFNINRKAEIAIPFFYQQGDDQKALADLSEFTLDCHYRYFLGNTQNGFYLSAFTRYANLRGIPWDASYSLSLGTPNPGQRETENKLGFGIGLGYRYFSYKSLYWGSSVSIGRYVLGKNDRFSSSSGFTFIDDDGQFIFDMELLKFGWAF
jgi:hypothetical protein